MRMSKSYRKSAVNWSKSRLWSGAVFILTLTLYACGSDLGERFSQGQVDAGAYGRVQESTLTKLLTTYVDSNRMVRYSNWLQNSADIDLLNTTLEAMSRADLSGLTLESRKSFYINAYNAMTLQLILSRYSSTLGGDASPYPGERSIRNIDRLDAKVWDHFKWKIAGRLVSLNDVENKILRPMGDARIHFAIVCASKGCPPILNRAITSDQIDAELESLSFDFVNSGRSTTISVERNEIKTSQILSWFNEDFVKSFGSVNKFFAKYVSGMDPSVAEGMRVKFRSYDWLLNESVEPAEEPTEPTPNPSPSSSPAPNPPTGSGSESEIPETDSL